MSKPEPDLSGKPGWEALDIPTSFGTGRSFVSGDQDGDRLRIGFFLPPDRERIVAQVWFGPGAEGPPGHAHGGSVAAVLDEAMGTAGWMSGHPVVAAKITIDFLHGVPLGQVHTVEAWIERADGRKVCAASHLLAEDGSVLSKGEGLFIEMSEKRIAALRELGHKPPGGNLFGTLKKRESTTNQPPRN